MATKDPNKKMYLIAIRGNFTKIAKEGVISYLFMEWGKMKKESAWNGWRFQVRNIDAYKKWPIYYPKKKENKR